MVLERRTWKNINKSTLWWPQKQKPLATYISGCKKKVDAIATDITWKFCQSYYMWKAWALDIMLRAFNIDWYDTCKKPWTIRILIITYIIDTYFEGAKVRHWKNKTPQWFSYWLYRATQCTGQWGTPFPPFLKTKWDQEGHRNLEVVKLSRPKMLVKEYFVPLSRSQKQTMLRYAAS